MKIVFGISGKAQHGKDTTANILKAEYGGERMALADLLKEQATYLGWDGTKDQGGRQFLQEFSGPIKAYGSWLAEKYPEKYGKYANGNYYSAKLYEKILQSDSDIIYVTDMRFKKEFKFFNNLPDVKFISVRITRPNYDNGLTKEQQNHISEIDLDNVKMDYMISNDGSLDDLARKVKAIAWR